MKFLILPICALLLIGCQPNPAISDALITASVSAGTSAGLKLAVQDAAKRKVIAQYLNTYAAALRTITGNPTDAQLTAQLLAFIPPDIATQYPELGSFAVPLVVSFYHWAQSTYGTNTAELQKVLNDVASGLEAGSAPFLLTAQVLGQIDAIADREGVVTISTFKVAGVNKTVTHQYTWDELKDRR